MHFCAPLGENVLCVSVIKCQHEHSLRHSLDLCAHPVFGA